MAPLGPLRECRCPCALQPSSCTRASLHLGWSCHCCSVSSIVALENAHCSSILYMVWYLIPAFHHSVREKMSPGPQPCGLWPQIARTVHTSGGSCWLRGHIEPGIPIHFIKSSQFWKFESYPPCVVSEELLKSYRRATPTYLSWAPYACTGGGQ